MSSLFDDIKDTYIELLSDFCATCICVLILLVFITCPVWVGPYMLIKRIKRKKEAKR